MCILKAFLGLIALSIFAHGCRHIMAGFDAASPIVAMNVANMNQLQTQHFYEDDIHIFLSTDDSEKIALYTVINSIVVNHNVSSSRLFFHILVEYNYEIYVKELTFLFSAYLLNDTVAFEVKQFSHYPRYYNFYPNYMTANKDNQRICKQMNFARFYFVDIFDLDLDVVQKAIYLDVDMIVQHDIEVLYSHEVNESVPIQSPFYGKGYNLKSYNLFGLAVRHRKLVKLLNISREMQSEKQGFNTGVYLYDLNYWNTHNLTKQYEYFVKLNFDHHGKLWKLGTQPIINLLFIHKQIGKVSKKWNVKNLGYDSKVTPYWLKRAYILHWNGEFKPWTKDAIGKYKQLWLKYLPENCNAHSIQNWSAQWDVSA